MSFVNEFASEEDVEKYDLNGIWDRYHGVRKGKYYFGHQPAFTIDRERNIFFMTIRQGREETANRTTALLWFGGQHVLVEIDCVDVQNPDGLKSNPFRIRWELAGIYPELGFTESREKIIEVLKEALTTYGYWGAVKQIPNTIVEFKS